MKVAFKRLAKSTGQVLTPIALANLWRVRKKPLAMTGELRLQFANGA